MPLYFERMNTHTHSWNADCILYFFYITHIDRLFMFDWFCQRGKVRPSLTNEIEADK